MNQLLPIENYLPHRDIMLLVDRLQAADCESAVAEVRVPRDGPFMENGKVPSWITIEYMAQTIAAWAGYQAVQKNQAVKVGFLLGTRKFEAFRRHLLADSVLRIETRCELQSDSGLGMFDCRVWEDQALIAQSQIAVFEPEDGIAFVQASATARNHNDE